MKAFLWGLVIGLIVSFPLGVNFGKGKPIFSNPLAEKPISEQISDTAKNASEKLKQTTDEVMEDTKDAINKTTE